MQNDPGHLEIPLGFGMALAQNARALNHFASLNREAQRDILSRARSVRSKTEMQRYVDSLEPSSL
jgi:hypothetical protein